MMHQRRRKKSQSSTHLNTADTGLLVVHHDRVDIPSQNRHDGSRVFIRGRLDQVDQSTLDTGECSLEVLERILELRFLVGLVLVRSDLAEDLQNLREFLVELRFGLSVMTCQCRDVRPVSWRTDAVRALRACRFESSFFDFVRFDPSWPSFVSSCAKRRTSTGILLSDSEGVYIGLSILHGRFFGRQSTKLALHDVELVRSGCESVALGLLLLRELVERLSLGNRLEARGRFTALNSVSG